MPRIRKISDFKPLFTNLAQTSHYQLIFGGLPSDLQSYLIKRGVSPFFIGESAGLLCFNASLPASNLTTKTVDGNFTGVSENFAVARTYGEITLDFYVDSNYLMIKFLESWMEFISSGSHNPIGNQFAGPVHQGEANYFIRMQYPETYKTSFTKIIKFDRNYEYFKQIEYTFVGLWPVSISPPAVAYNQSDVLKISATFKYDRYIAGRALSLNRFIGNDNNQENNTNNRGTQTNNNQRVVYRTGSALGESGVRGVIFTPGNVNPTIVT